jgi:hypothetical protein
VEGPNPKNSEEAMGRTSHNKLCFFPGDGFKLKGTLVDVRVEEIRAYTLSGRIAAPPQPLVSAHHSNVQPWSSPERSSSLVLNP